MGRGGGKCNRADGAVDGRLLTVLRQVHDAEDGRTGPLGERRQRRDEAPDLRVAVTVRRAEIGTDGIDDH